VAFIEAADGGSSEPEQQIWAAVGPDPSALAPSGPALPR